LKDQLISSYAQLGLLICESRRGLFIQRKSDIIFSMLNAA